MPRDIRANTDGISADFRLCALDHVLDRGRMRQESRLLAARQSHRSDTNQSDAKGAQDARTVNDQ